MGSIFSFVSSFDTRAKSKVLIKFNVYKRKVTVRNGNGIVLLTVRIKR